MLIFPIDFIAISFTRIKFKTNNVQFVESFSVTIYMQKIFKYIKNKCYSCVKIAQLKLNLRSLRAMVNLVPAARKFMEELFVQGLVRFFRSHRHENISSDELVDDLAISRQ